MLRTRLAKSYIKRTFRPLYGWTQQTPKSVFLDPLFDRSVNIFPGMVMSLTGPELVSVFGIAAGLGAAPTVPYGFSALYVGGDGIDEPLDVGINAFAVWVMGPDAEAEVLAPAFDTTASWVNPTGTAAQVVNAGTGAKAGLLVPAAAATAPTIGRLLKVNSATKITIGGLSGNPT
jgi:hypothetical protein